MPHDQKKEAGKGASRSSENNAFQWKAWVNIFMYFATNKYFFIDAQQPSNSYVASYFIECFTFYHSVITVVPHLGPFIYHVKK